MADVKQLSLANIGNGAAVALFDEQLQKVLDNIKDLDTPAEAVREVAIVVKIKPNINRNMADIAYVADCKLARRSPLASNILIDRKKSGQVIAAEMLAGGLDPDRALIPGVEEEVERLHMNPPTVKVVGGRKQQRPAKESKTIDVEAAEA